MSDDDDANAAPAPDPAEPTTPKPKGVPLHNRKYPQRSRMHRNPQGAPRITKTRVAKILQRSINGESRRDVARAENCSPQAVQKVIELFKPIFKNLDQVPGFRASKGDISDSAQLMAMRSLVDETKHEKATLTSAAYAMDVLYKIGRLERGQSTSNVAVVYFTKEEP